MSKWLIIFCSAVVGFWLAIDWVRELVMVYFTGRSNYVYTF